MVAHLQVDRLAGESFADVIVFEGVDLVDATATARRLTAAPVLVVGGDERGGATCLAIGADAWLPEQCSSVLVAAQIESLLRRPAAPAALTSVSAGAVTIHMDARRAEVLGRELQLTPREFELLKVLVANAGKVLSRDGILEAAWGSRFVGEPKTVDVHVAWLRPKLEGSGVRVTTLRGLGYRLDVLNDASAQGAEPVEAGRGAGAAPMRR